MSCMFRISATWFIFNPQRRKIWKAQDSIFFAVHTIQQNMYGNKWRALCARIRASLHNSPMLGINCSIPHRLLTPPPYPGYSRQPRTTMPFDIFQARRRRHASGTGLTADIGHCNCNIFKLFRSNQYAYNPLSFRGQLGKTLAGF